MFSGSVIVSNLAICQRCPRLMAYAVHKGAINAWRIGIMGNGVPYGSIFHKKIATPFFKAAFEPHHPIRNAIVAALVAEQNCTGTFPNALLDIVERHFFYPFLDAHAQKYSVEQLTALARGTENWVHAMAEFLVGIPSLRNNPMKNMDRVFFKPETKITAVYNSQHGELSVTGRFDALLLDPDEGEAVIFEFKGYNRSNSVVPLSQALAYAWLFKQKTGITPGVQVIYLSEKQDGIDKFSSSEVQAALDGLPCLFDAALDVLAEKLPLPRATSPYLCGSCPFVGVCDQDWGCN